MNCSIASEQTLCCVMLLPLLLLIRLNCRVENRLFFIIVALLVGGSLHRSVTRYKKLISLKSDFIFISDIRVNKLPNFFVRVVSTVQKRTILWTTAFGLSYLFKQKFCGKFPKIWKNDISLVLVGPHTYLTSHSQISQSSRDDGKIIHCRYTAHLT